MKKMNIGEKLRYIRKHNNLSLENIASVLGVTPQTVSRYEKGQRTPDNEVLAQYGKYFKLDGNWLLFGDNPIFRDPTGENKKDIRQTFLELAAELPEIRIETVDIQILRESLDEITKNSAENYLIMLQYMFKDEKIRRKMFQFFFLFLKMEADQSMEQCIDMEKGEKGSVQEEQAES